MGLADVVRSAVATAKSVVLDLMDDVAIQYWIGDKDDAGSGKFTSPVFYKAIVIRKQKIVLTSSGQEVMSNTYVAFLEELKPVAGVTGRREPLDERDVITSADGTTGPILRIDGLMDAGTHSPYLFEVYLG